MKKFVQLLLGLLLISACVPSPVGPALQNTSPSTTLPAPVVIAAASNTSSSSTAVSGSAAALPVREKPLAFPSELSVEEHALKGAPQLDPLTFELAQGSVAEVMRKHHVERSGMPRLTANNQLLKPFGFRMTLDTLYHDEKPVLQNVYGFGSASVNASGNDFVMLTESQTGTLLVRKNVVTPWNTDNSTGNTSPLFLDDDLLVATETWKNANQKLQDEVQLSRAGKVIYTLSVGNPGANMAVRGLWVYAGHWILEVTGQVIEDGQSLNERADYDETFGFQLLQGEPFYFFKKGSAIGAVYAGQEIQLRYNEVPHYGCCSPAELNPISAENMLAFFAQRDGRWYYVEIGVFA